MCVPVCVVPSLLLTLRSAADFFDAENAEFFYAKLSYSYGAGMCYITGALPLLHGASQRPFVAWQHGLAFQHSPMLSLHGRQPLARARLQGSAAGCCHPNSSACVRRVALVAHASCEWPYPGTNVMIRAQAAFAVSRYAKTGFQSSSGRNQIYSEDEISEDIELGSRIHAAGYKSVFVAERLATGEARSPSCSRLLCSPPCTLLPWHLPGHVRQIFSQQQDV